MTTVLSTNRVDSGSFSSRGCAFRRTHTSVDRIWVLCIRLALPLTLSLPSRFAPSAKLMVCISLRVLWLAGAFPCDCTFWDFRGVGLTRQPVGPLDEAAITTVTSTNHVDSGSFSSRRCTFWRTHTSANPIRLLCIRPTITLTLCRPSRFVPSARLMVDVSPRALWFVWDVPCDCMFWDERGGGLTGQPVGPQVDPETITILSTNRVNSGVLAQDVGRSVVHIQAPTLFGYFVSD